ALTAHVRGQGTADAARIVRLERQGGGDHWRGRWRRRRRRGRGWRGGRRRCRGRGRSRYGVRRRRRGRGWRRSRGRGRLDAGRLRRRDEDLDALLRVEIAGADVSVVHGCLAGHELARSLDRLRLVAGEVTGVRLGAWILSVLVGRRTELGELLQIVVAEV